MASAVLISKSKKPPVQSARARERSVQKMSAMIEREVQRRLGPNFTFEQRNNMAAEITREGLHRREGDDLERMTTDEEVIDEEDRRPRGLPGRGVALARTWSATPPR